MRRNLKDHDRKRRSKKTHRGLAMKAADDAMSLYIKERDHYRCVTCGKRAMGQAMHCGHFISRKSQFFRYDSRNCHAQCAYCNKFLSGNWAAYFEAMVKMYGREVVDEMILRRDQETKRTIQDFLGIEEYYKDRLKELLAERGED